MAKDQVTAGRRAGEDLRVLVVDDEEHIRHIVSE